MEPAEDSTGLSSWANVTELSISPICSMMPSDTAMRNHSVIDHKITGWRIIDKIGHFPWSHPYLGLSQIRREPESYLWGCQTSHEIQLAACLPQRASEAAKRSS